jgi:hypothetical protein
MSWKATGETEVSSLGRKRGTQLTHPGGMKARILRLIELKNGLSAVNRGDVGYQSSFPDLAHFWRTAVYE